jgi:hypothetical protein
VTIKFELIKECVFCKANKETRTKKRIDKKGTKGQRLKHKLLIGQNKCYEALEKNGDFWAKQRHANGQ